MYVKDTLSKWDWIMAVNKSTLFQYWNEQLRKKEGLQILCRHIQASILNSCRQGGKQNLGALNIMLCRGDPVNPGKKVLFLKEPLPLYFLNK